MCCLIGDLRNLRISNSGMMETHATLFCLYISQMAYADIGQNALLGNGCCLYIGVLLSDFQEET